MYKCVGHVAHEHDVLPLSDHLADGEGAAEDAHVFVNAHDDDVRDAVLPHEVERFRGVCDGVPVLDLDGGMLPFPGHEARAIWAAVAAAIRVVDRQRWFLLILPRAPALDGDLGFNFGRRLREFASRMVFVEPHRLAGAMDDEDAALAGSGEDVVHDGREFADAIRCVRAPMAVPHIADDDGGVGGFPGAGLLNDTPFVGGVGDGFPVACVEFEGRGKADGNEGVEKRDERGESESLRVNPHISRTLGRSSLLGWSRAKLGRSFEEFGCF